MAVRDQPESGMHRDFYLFAHGRERHCQRCSIAKSAREKSFGQRGAAANIERRCIRGQDKHIDQAQRLVHVPAEPARLRPALVTIDRFPMFLARYVHPTAPSSETSSNFFASTANSIGNSLNTCLQKPSTIIDTASSSAMPRLRQ